MDPQGAKAQAEARRVGPELGQTVGPYVLEDVLGRGGMGVVYRARHVGDGRRVALKRVHAREGVLEGVQRAIRALASLRHRGIVRVVDHGAADGLPWYAMELVEGQTLRQWLDGCLRGGEGWVDDLATRQQAPLPWWTQTLVQGDDTAEAEAARARRPSREAASGLGLSQALRLLQQTCWILAYMHGQGVVHRDLKPDNIVVTGAGEVVLVDFGLAAQARGGLGREAMELVGGMEGTATYMAPEQGDSGWLDARCDLYAVGCMLYEVLVGEPPFVRDSALATVMAHLTAAPEAPSARGLSVPEELEALALRLLAKRPEARPGYAEDVARALGAWLGEEAAPDDGAQVGRAVYLYRPALVGRGRALGQMEQVWGEARAGRGGLVWVEGEGGVGKTRLALEWVQQARRAAFEVWPCACAPPGDARHGEALQAAEGALRRIADARWSQRRGGDAARMGREARALAPWEPALERLVWVRRAPALAPLPPDEARGRALRALARLAEGSALERPVLWVIDDAQWIDPWTLEALALLARLEAWARAPLVVLVVARAEGPQAAGLAALREAATVVQALGRLSAGDVGRLVRSMLAWEQAPEAFARTLWARSEGNPFYAAEYLRGAARAGLLTRDARGRWALDDARDPTQTLAGQLRALPMPEALRALLRAKLGGLPGGPRALLEAAAVLGHTMSEAVLADTADAQALRHLHALLRHDLLRAEGEGRLRFTHALLVEVAREGIDPARGRALHRRAAQAYARAPDADPLLAAQAFHWLRAGDAARARPLHLRAAQRAQADGRLSDAARLCATYLELSAPLAPSRERLQARQMSAELCYAIGRLAPCRQTALEAQREAAQLGAWPDAAQALRSAARAARTQGDLDAAEALLAQAAALPGAADDGDGADARAEHLLESALLRVDQHRLAEAQADAAQALDLLGASPRAADLRGQLLAVLASVHYQQGHFHTTCALYQQALDHHRATGDRRQEGIVVGNLASVFFRLGRYAEAAAGYAQALDLHREAENLSYEGTVLSNLASARRKLGFPEDAEPLYRRALDLHRALGNPRAEGVTWTNLGTLAHERGDLADALDHLSRALDLHVQAHNGRWRGYTLIFIAEAQRHLGAVEAARDALDAASAIFDALDDAAYHRLLIACQRGHLVLAAAPQPPPRAALDAAAAHLHRALALSRDIDLAPGSPPALALDRLDAACRAAAAPHPDAPLVAGQRLDDLDPRLRAALRAAWARV